MWSQNASYSFRSLRTSRRSLELGEFRERGTFCTLHPMYVPSKSGLECLARPGLQNETTVLRSRLASRIARSRSETQLYSFEGLPCFIWIGDYYCDCCLCPPLNKLVKWNLAIFPFPKNFHKFTLTP